MNYTEDLIERLESLIDGDVIEWQSIHGYVSMAIDALKEQAATIEMLEKKVKNEKV
jgi:hypothetical protein